MIEVDYEDIVRRLHDKAVTCDDYYVKDIDIFTECADAIETLLEEQPTVDAVPVVRCKDCKYYQIENQHDNEYRCCKYKYMANHNGDWFCADGEKNERDTF